jgi:hypothetical protein
MHKYINARMNGLYDYDDEERDYTRNSPEPISFYEMLVSIFELIVYSRFLL